MDVREKLVELLTGYSIDTKTDVEYVADHLITHGVTVQDVPDMNDGKWISVKDRLPEEPLQTILVTNGKETCVGVYSIVYDQFGVMCGRGRDKSFGVTHWMPLPQPWMPMPQPPKGE